MFFRGADILEITRIINDLLAMPCLYWLIELIYGSTCITCIIMSDGTRALIDKRERERERLYIASRRVFNAKGHVNKLIIKDYYYYCCMHRNICSSRMTNRGQFWKIAMSWIIFSESSISREFFWSIQGYIIDGIICMRVVTRILR